MRKTLLTTALAALVFAQPGAATQAASSGLELDRLLPGSEVRRSVQSGNEWRNDVITLKSDGTAKGAWEIRISPVFGGGMIIRQGAISGAWSLEKGRVCLNGDGFGEAPRACYRLTKSSRSTHEYGATDERTGQIWQVFIYSPNVL